jgi:fructose-bisphosphate aldolase class I
MDAEQMAAVARKPAFIAALDQSGGSTPGALRLYGVPDDDYHGDAEMFAQMHAMRVRIITSPAFSGERVLGAILFEKTMDGEAQGLPVPTYLWKQRGIVPFLKVDEGLAAEADGVSLMKPMPGLPALLDRALARGVFGTKMRSVIHRASPSGIAAIVAQQFQTALEIAGRGLVPIVEPEISIKSPDKAQSEALLRESLLGALDALPADISVMLKLTLPETADFYSALVGHPKVIRVVGLSGGYARADACARLARNRGVIASFSRALVEDLRKSMSDAEFDAALGAAIGEIFAASTGKDGARPL